MSQVDTQIEARAAGSGASASSDGWDLDGIPPRFWPKVRELLRMREQTRYSQASMVVASALVNAVALESIARRAGSGGEGIAKSAASFVAEWDGELCPPYRKWPPKKKRFVAEEILEILSEVVDVTPEGAFGNSLRNLGGSMQQKLDRAGSLG
jgi:hypothetical protein